MSDDENMEQEVCPFCHKKGLTLDEKKVDIPYFGNVFVFSMTCSECKFHKADLEAEESKPACKYTFEIDGVDDLKVRVVKSAEATIKIPRVTTISPGAASQGYVSNIEGILNRVKKVIEEVRDTEDDPAARKKAKNLLKKLQKVLWGDEKLSITIEDPSGNSAIISEKATKKLL